MKKIVCLLMLGIIAIACDKGPTTPEGLLEKYTVDITKEKQDREYYEKYTTGKILADVPKLEEGEELGRSDALKNVKNPKIDIKSKVCEADKCTLTYIIKYEVVGGKAKAFNSEVKKVATLVKEGGAWKIAEVANVKTYIEAFAPIDAMKKTEQELTAEKAESAAQE